MDNTAQMEANLDNIKRGAIGFRVVGTVAVVLGLILVAVAVLRLVPLMDAGAGTMMASLLENMGGVLNYFLVGWLAHRASDAFEAVAALIREMGEIV